MQDRIDDANDQIDKNHDDDPSNDKPVNEEDFGDHNVDFYDDYEDGNGNLDDSVENITTDPEGDQTGEPLPDPNETGEEFDAAMDGYGIPTEFIDEGDGEIISDYGDGGNAQGNTKNSAPAPTPEVQARVAEPVEAYVEEEPVYTPVEIPATEYVSEDAYIEYNVPSNEEIVEEYLNSLEGQELFDTFSV